ncbi:MAG: GerMN domain-containing protein [Spirochaetaceae bacterium]|nr:GerMN domain-containing protein [Spirochaetaceae bacterium]
MATSRRKKTGGWLLFWMAFFIALAVLFMANLERIKATLRETKVLERLAGEASEEVEEAPAAEDPALSGPEIPALPQEPAEPPPAPPVAAAEKPDAGTQAPSPANEKKTVERPLYLIKVDNSGAILGTRVKRTLPSSDSPLQDVLEALMAGPSAEEKKQGFISLIPANVKLLNAVVRGNTAYINLSEDFLFNTHGVEGYIGQRRQLVLTATEFSTVNDVQILIDGKRLDYLGESIWIGSPIDRTML